MQALLVDRPPDRLNGERIAHPASITHASLLFLPLFAEESKAPAFSPAREFLMRMRKVV